MIIINCIGVGVVKYVVCEPFHDGVRIYWHGHNYVDSIGITYALQMSREGSDDEYVNIYRGKDEEMRQGKGMMATEILQV